MIKESVECEGNNKSVIDFQQGDAGAFPKIFESYKSLINSCVASALKYGESDADDLRQEAAIALFLAAENYDIHNNGVTFGLYAKICIKNRLVSYLRKSSLVPDEAIDDVMLEAPSDENPERRCIDAESIKLLESAVRELFTDYERAVFRLWLAEKSYAEIAAVLNKNEKSVDNAIRRIKSKLADRLL